VGSEEGVVAVILGGEGMPEWRQRVREVAATVPGRASRERRRAGG
jgi:hypothetical protein